MEKLKRTIDTIHSVIENTYAIDSGIEDITDFLMAEDVYRELEDDVVTRVPYDDSARVYVTIDGEDALLGMYLSEELRDAIEEHDPLRTGITEKTLPVISVLTEEIDHLLMLGYSLTHEKPTSLLELELQANVSKCLLVRNMVARQQGTYPRIDKEARKEVDEYILHTDFAEPENLIQLRYQDAARFAKGFMSYFDELPRQQKPGELAAFYRLTPPQKINRVRRNAAFDL